MKVGRPKEFDENKVLDIAMNYFWDKGYDNTSLSQLLNEMKISKSSFYQTFGSKQALFERAIALYVDQQTDWIESQLEIESAKNILMVIFQHSISEIREYGEIKGCLVMNSAEICYKKYPDLSALINQQFQKFHQLFTRVIRIGQQKKEISSRNSPEMLASIYLNTLNGLSIMIKAGADDSMLDDVLKGFEMQL